MKGTTLDLTVMLNTVNDSRNQRLRQQGVCLNL